MEENKDMKNVCANCPCHKGKMGHGCCCGKGSIIVVIILIALAFYAGTLCAGKYNFRRGDMFRNRIINNSLNTEGGSQNTASDSITIEVTPKADADTNTPPVLE